MVQLAYYQQRLKQRYDSNVKLRPLAPGDLVVRKVEGTVKKPNMGEVRAQLGRAVSYHLNSKRRSILPRRSRRKSCATTLECK